MCQFKCPNSSPWCPYVCYLCLCLYCCSVAKLCPTLCDPMDCSTPGSSVLHYLPEPAQIHVHWVGDAIQPSHHLPILPPFAFSLSQHPGLCNGVSVLQRRRPQTSLRVFLTVSATWGHSKKTTICTPGRKWPLTSLQAPYLRNREKLRSVLKLPRLWL